MKIAKYIYEKLNNEPAPYYYDYSVLRIISKPVRKWTVNVLAANCPFNTIRIFLYRLSGFKIGKHTFIGMRCYLDDMCYELITIEKNVTISYGVYFACHGKNQDHRPVLIKKGAYIGMRSSIISKNVRGGGIVIGKNAVIGACTLVNRDIPEGSTAVGIPCKIIKN